MRSKPEEMSNALVYILLHTQTKSSTPRGRPGITCGTISMYKSPLECKTLHKRAFYREGNVDIIKVSESSSSLNQSTDVSFSSVSHAYRFFDSR